MSTAQQPPAPVVSRPPNRDTCPDSLARYIPAARERAPRGDPLVALTCGRADELHWLGEPELPLIGAVLAIDPSTHNPRHPPALLSGIAGNAGLVRPTRAVHLGCADTLKPDLLARSAMDRAVYVVEGDGEAEEEGHATYWHYWRYWHRPTASLYRCQERETRRRDCGVIVAPAPASFCGPLIRELSV